MSPAPRRLRKVLVANRGEVALRVIRACRARGLATVAIYSDADRGALHVRAAEEAYRVGGPEPAESYLNIPAIVDAARRAGADAVHPGYGFLSENPALAHACTQARLVFVGPPADTLALCGDKAATRRRAAAAGVPLLAGTEPVDDHAAIAASERLGFPVLIKAAAGGGGKGIHLVARPAALPGALRLARGEARSAFGDDRVYLEQWLEGPRHIEVQILADDHGSVIHLGERDCSIQRRHQKLIEESPAPRLPDGLREALRHAAVTAARAVAYRNAGTVEFLVSRGSFYFLEINARLQVEHPVTEMVTGIDLVARQLGVAAGEPLPGGQDQIRLRGHAIECRISAEDAENQFLPWVGRIGAVLLPGGPWVRIDGALAPGMEISRHYDPLLAKIIAWGSVREEAIARMAAALGETVVTGVPTTVPFHRWAMAHPAFRSGEYTTRFVEAEWAPARARPEGWLAALAAAALAYRDEQKTVILPPQGPSGWIRAARQEGIA
ncbi:MAG TPA: biotin carboxylase N-terminal domain-containing protein [bacterium]|nr:biotin carboxylase N-terminal domain-containing protein [bacterium]